jgi:hypothetical protein
MGAELLLDGEEPWSSVLVAMEYFFVAIFFTEMILQILAQRLAYFCNPGERTWNLIDFSVVWISVADSIIIPIASSGGSNVDIRAFSVMRLCRLARVFKMLRLKKELVMIIEGIITSLRSMVWLSVLLFIIVYASAIFCVQVVGRSDLYDRNVWDNKFYFGTLWDAMMTLFNIGLGYDWPIRDIAKVQWYLVPWFYTYMLFICFGILNSIIGIIVQRTSDAAREAEVNDQKLFQQTQQGMVEELRNLMWKTSASGGGDDDEATITEEELEIASRNPQMRAILKQIDVPQSFTVQDIHLMLDRDGDGQLTEEEFTEGMYDMVYNNSFQTQCTLQLSSAMQKRKIYELRTLVESLFGELKSDIRKLAEGGLRASAFSGVGGGAPCGSPTSRLPNPCVQPPLPPLPVELPMPPEEFPPGSLPSRASRQDVRESRPESRRLQSRRKQEVSWACESEHAEQELGANSRESASLSSQAASLEPGRQSGGQADTVSSLHRKASPKANHNALMDVSDDEHDERSVVSETERLSF